MTHAVNSGETLLFAVLLELGVMLALARAFNAAARALGQPGVIGEILAGLVLGPSLFSHFYPGQFGALFPATTRDAITIISQIGLLLLMLQIGMEFDFGHLALRRHRAVTGWVAAVSIVFPFVSGFGFGLLSAQALAPGMDRVIYSLFCGVAVAITAVPILGRILHEFGMARTPVGVMAIAAAAINDVVGWLLLACISAIATARFSAGHFSLQIAGLAAGAAVMWYVLRPFVQVLLRLCPLREGRIPANLMAAVLCLTIGLGLYTSTMGIFTIFGGFAAGLLFHAHADFVRAWRDQVGQFVLVFFLPVFFTFTGLRTNLLGLNAAADFAWLAVILVLSAVSKILPVYTAGRLGGLGHWPSALLGSLMNTRALMELIVLNIGYGLGFLPQKVFTMLVIMAVCTTAMTGPLLQVCRRHLAYPVRRSDAVPSQILSSKAR